MAESNDLNQSTNELDQSEKARIRQEELFRLEIRGELAAERNEQEKGKAYWAFVNSPFFLWLLSSVLIGSITFFYGEWEERRAQEEFKMQQGAKLREAAFESLSTDLSRYVFYSDILTKGFEEEWWKPSGLKSTVPKYNDAIRALRGHEYLYRGNVKSLWGQQELECFNKVMEKVRVYDDLVHKMNAEIGAVTSEQKEDIDFAKVEPITNELRPAVIALEDKSKTLLDSLTKLTFDDFSESTTDNSEKDEKAELPGDQCIQSHENAPTKRQEPK